MNEKEYFSVSEISKKHKMTARNVRKIISKLKEQKSKDLLRKNNVNEWQIHHLLLPEFKRQRIKQDKYYALTIDPCRNYGIDELNSIMYFIFENTVVSDENLEINYVVEKKKSNEQNHIHCYIRTNQKRKLMQNIKDSFSTTSYHESEIFDLEGWKNYITKDGNKITTLLQ